MSKTTEYIIKYYHFSDEEAMENLAELCGVLGELLPGCDVKYESCKSDFGLLTIRVYEALRGDHE